MWNMFYQRENGNIINLASIIYIDFSINRVYINRASSAAYSGCTIPSFLEPSKKEMSDILERINIKHPNEETVKKHKQDAEKVEAEHQVNEVRVSCNYSNTTTSRLTDSTWSDGTPCINRNDVDPEDDRYTVFGVPIGAH